MLEELGYRVVAAGGPGECLRFAEAGGAAVDLLVTDVVMPGLDGRRLHERLAALHPGLPVVYISGYAGDVLDQRGVAEAGAVLLAKPFTADALGVAVRRALRAGRPEAT
jgi:CheY-like chemotaxis protein